MLEEKHYVPRRVAEVDYEKDKRVVLVGRVKEVRENSIVFEDGSGEVEIGFVDGLKERKVVRVFCTVVEGRLLVDFFQVLENFNMEMWEKVNKLYERANV